MKRLALVIVLFVCSLLGFVNEVQAQEDGSITNTPVVTVRFEVDDLGCGMGAGSQIQFSNDSTTWSQPEPYSEIINGWDLRDYGGGDGDGEKTVYARGSDACGNWTNTVGPAIINIDWTPPTVIRFEIVGAEAAPTQ